MAPDGLSSVLIVSDVPSDNVRDKEILLVDLAGEFVLFEEPP